MIILLLPGRLNLRQVVRRERAFSGEMLFQRVQRCSRCEVLLGTGHCGKVCQQMCHVPGRDREWSAGIAVRRSADRARCVRRCPCRSVAALWRCWHFLVRCAAAPPPACRQSPVPSCPRRVCTGCGVESDRPEHRRDRRGPAPGGRAARTPVSTRLEMRRTSSLARPARLSKGLSGAVAGACASNGSEHRANRNVRAFCILSNQCTIRVGEDCLIRGQSNSVRKIPPSLADSAHSTDESETAPRRKNWNLPG